jgi:predicted amidohydrolase YtcJ
VADFIILDRDIVKMGKDKHYDIKTAVVLQTVLEGEEIFRNDALYTEVLL